MAFALIITMFLPSLWWLILRCTLPVPLDRSGWWKYVGPHFFVIGLLSLLLVSYGILALVWLIIPALIWLPQFTVVAFFAYCDIEEADAVWQDQRRERAKQRPNRPSKRWLRARSVEISLKCLSDLENRRGYHKLHHG